MALKKVCNTDFGGTVEYWRVAKTLINWVQEQAHITVFGYLDEATRQAGKAPFVVENFVFEVHRDFGGVKTPFQFSPQDNVVDKAYTLLKAEDFFTGSEDV